MAKLRRGDLLPRIVHPQTGNATRAIARQLARWEAPGINTLDTEGSTLVWQEARGSNVLDVEGNRYIDLTSGFGVAGVGHRHPRVVTAVRRQAGLLLHGLGDVHAHPVRARVAHRLAQRSPIDRTQTYFAVSGSDAVEIALKTSILATGREAVLSFVPAYHGLSFGALQLTSRAAFREPFRRHLTSRIHRLEFGCPRSKLEASLKRHSDIACVVVEPIAGREGILSPPAGWLADLRQLCGRHGALLVADEIYTGLGRTGRWFAVDHDRVQPDLVCCGKTLAGGLPLAAVLGSQELLSTWSRAGEPLHTATFVAHPLACAAALSVLEVLASERLPQRAARLGKAIAKAIEDWPLRFDSVVAVRGRGLMWGVELCDRPVAETLLARLRRRGLLALAGGPQGTVLQINPPLVIAERQLRFALETVADELDGMKA